MPQNLLAIHGVLGLICAVGEGGRILMFRGDIYEPFEPGSPTKATLRGVWVQSPQAAWAVGDDGTVIHWNGFTWEHVALAPKGERLSCVWGDPAFGLWIGAGKHLINYSADGQHNALVQSDVEIRAIWGTGPTDMWLLAAGRAVMHWTGDYCAGDSLPGDADEEWNAIAGGAPDEHVYLVGIMGLVMEWTGEQWLEFDTETNHLIMGACCVGPDLYVVTEMGLMRCYDGAGWRTVAFSAFGALNSCCFVDGVVWACGARGVVLQHQPEDGGNE